MARPKGSKNKRSIDFEQRYDKYLAKYGDPIETLFKLTNRNQPAKIKLQAAVALLPYKYSKKGAEAPDGNGKQQELFTLVRADGQSVAG